MTWSWLDGRIDGLISILKPCKIENKTNPLRLPEFAKNRCRLRLLPPFSSKVERYANLSQTKLTTDGGDASPLQENSRTRYMCFVYGRAASCQCNSRLRDSLRLVEGPVRVTLVEIEIR